MQENLVSTRVTLPKRIHRELKIRAAGYGISLQDLILAVLTEEVNKPMEDRE
jgi:predicted HicB family RNase H-like nuclease